MAHSPVSQARPGSSGLVMLAALAMLLALAAPPAATAQQEEQDEVTPARVDGQTRFHTAANLATFLFDEAEVAHIVFAGDFPDALAASFGAGATGGPILPVPSQEVGADSPTMRALEELDVQRVVLVGGTGVISAAVEQEFAAHGYDTDRIAGVDRYDTAASVALHYGEHVGVGTVEGQRTALLASGQNFPDALSAGPLAHGLDLPLLLTPRGHADERVNAALEALEIERIIVIGGTGAVTSEVVLFYENLGYEMERFGGATRTETATIVADNAIERFGFSPSLALLAQGNNFPDALAASVHGGLSSAPILLTASPTVLSPETRSWFAEQCPAVDVIRAIGGTGAVSAAVLSEAVDAAEACFADPAPENNQSYIIAPQEPITAEPGYEQEFHLIGTYDDGPVHAGELALFPCEAVHRDGAFVTFTEDPNNPGHALGAGETDTDQAWISQINDVEQAPDQRRDRGFVPDNYNFHVRSNAVDCTVPVIWDTEGPQPAELEIDANGEPTVRFGVGEIQWVDDPEPHTEQSYIQAPQEVLTAEPGWTFEITVFGFDEPGNPAPVDIALFPCDVADPADPDAHTFRDAVGDGFADGIGTTDTGQAVISSLHGDSTATTHLDAVQPDAQGQIEYTIYSQAEDCAIPVVFHDANGNNQLDVDGQGRPLEHFNFTERTWQHD